jgi:mycothiol synthase
MSLKLHPCQDEADYWRIRNFLREVFLINGRLEHSWNVARLDYWRWHIIKNCQSTDLFEKVTATWQKEDGELAAVLHPISQHEIRLHVHPHFRTPELENEMIAFAEEHYADRTSDGKHILYVPVFTDDFQRQETLSERGFSTQPGWGHHWRRDLDMPLPKAAIPTGYEIRSMGTLEEYPARSWASFRAFHADEPTENCDGDFSWYLNIQSAPLYRRDLDVIAATPEGEIATFCTIYYDDFTRSAVTVLVGTAAEHWRRGLGKAVMIEGMHRLKNLGCTRVFSTAHDEAADALYGSVMQEMKVTDTWVKMF